MFHDLVLAAVRGGKRKVREDQIALSRHVADLKLEVARSLADIRRHLFEGFEPTVGMVERGVVLVVVGEILMEMGQIALRRLFEALFPEPADDRLVVVGGHWSTSS